MILKVLSSQKYSGIRDNGFKLEQDTFRLDIRRKFFIMRIMKYWSRFPRDVVEDLSLETFRVKLDAALSNLI